MIRPYHPADKQELLKIFRLNTPKFFDPKEEKDFEGYLEVNGNTYLTIEHEGNIVGGTGYQITDHGSIGRITWIFFHPENAGLGLGRQAVEHCLAILRQTAKVQKIIVTTSQLAYRFFEKFGLSLVHMEKDYWGKGLDLYVMEGKVR